MLKRLVVQGFKTLRRADLEFGRVNLFIGGNGSGKSNVLEALGVLSAGLKDISDIELQRRGVRLSVPTLFKSAFRTSSLLPTLDLTATFESDVSYKLGVKAGSGATGLRFFSENVRHKGKSLMGRSPNGIKVLGESQLKKDIDPNRSIWDRFRETLNLPESVQLELSRMSTYAIYAPQTAFLRGTEVESLPVQPIGLQGGGLAQAAMLVNRTYRTVDAYKDGRRELYAEVMNIIQAPGWSENFYVGPFNAARTSRQVKTGSASLYFYDRFMAKNRNTLSAYDSSEGTLYLLFMAVLLLHPDAPKIYSLDNVDNALNPKITRLLLQLVIRCACSTDFRNAGVGPDQVFLTSHNPTSLDAFDLFDDEQRIFVTQRESRTGNTSVTRLRPPEGMTRAAWIKAADGKNLSELWIEGKIKGALGL
jgi:predicted ATPase